ncbi:MAG TPA: KpsF/GutQ family sugar-phosphate isomerase [Leucothrix mucor]|uniref:Arabinose 5-phosphate isomerase n=1 Tax=Leucothrix mucor TaxID=45248 RepID=A0A7V2WUF8_LEUMU|nr:KpsF/GutQ family sugar-phosphate isomerase [Leucothrix mucor]
MTSKNATSDSSFIHSAKKVIWDEQKAIEALAKRLDKSFDAACETILASTGRVVITGMGKSGHISNKIASTLASTGTPSFFVHPSEALHGDLGMITANDVVIAISNSGSTNELLILSAVIKRQNTKVIAMTGNANSDLAKLADVHLDIGVEKEACPLDLAPTSSTTVTLVMGDALAVALLKTRDFTPEDFARSHPGGRLGRRLLVRVKEIMHDRHNTPLVTSDTLLVNAIIEMTKKNLGTTLIIDNQNRLLGIFTDGDLRRAFEDGTDMPTTTIGERASMNCYTTHVDDLAVSALNIMQDNEITVLPVVDSKNKAVGILHMHDLLKSGII